MKIEDYTKEDLINLYRNAKDNKYSKCYFDVCNPTVSWTIDLSDDKINYYYGPTIWKYNNNDPYIGLIFQDRSKSTRQTILYHKITIEIYDELLEIWRLLNGNEQEKENTSGYKIVPQQVSEYLVNKLNIQH